MQQFDHLANGEDLLVAHVEHRSGGPLGALDRQHHGRCAVLRVAVMMKGEAVVGDDDPPSAVDDTANDRPFPGGRLVWPVEVRITEVGGPRMGGEDGGFGPDDAVALLVDGPVDDEVGALLHRHGEAGRVVLPGVGPPPVGGHATDGHEVTAEPGRDLGDHAQAPVHGHDHIPRRARQHLAHRCRVIGVGVDVHQVGGGLGSLVAAPVEDRNIVAIRHQPPDDGDAGRARTADHEDPHRRSQAIMGSNVVPKVGEQHAFARHGAATSRGVGRGGERAQRGGSWH